MQGSMAHFDEKLLLLETMMKTDPGLALARERTKTLKQFAADWEEEFAIQDIADVVLGDLVGKKR